MSDIDILYQFIRREIDNLIERYCPALNFISSGIKNYVINAIDPYVKLFYMGTDDFNVEAAGAYVKSELDDKINKFIKKYDAEKKRLGDSND